MFQSYQLPLAPPGLHWWLSGKASACSAGETRIQSLGQEDPLEKEITTHSSILVRKSGQESGGLQSMGTELDTTERLSMQHPLVVEPNRQQRT